MKKYKPSIGLEIHAQLSTESKMFCRCVNDSDEKKPNINICPICTGQPGALPVANKEAIRRILQVGVSLEGGLADFTEFDRKHYFYPDIPKGYQISQDRHPLIKGGSLTGVTLTRVHLEEDTARSTHDSGGGTLVDFNRSGIPLMELVTEPEIKSGEQAVFFARELRLLLRTLGVGKANMEKGEMRVEANVSLSDNDKLGVKVEVKNLNSFKAVERAVAYEIERQTDILDRGEKVVQETRGWDEGKQVTVSQRIKEESHDYRYFPEPDIPPFLLSEYKEFSIERLRASLPELPWEKRERYRKEYGISEEQTESLINSPSFSEFFEESVKLILPKSKDSTKKTANYILSDIAGIMKEKNLKKIFLSPSNYAELISMLVEGKLSSRGAKDILLLMFEGKEVNARELAIKHNLIQKEDDDLTDKIAEEVIKENPKVIKDYKEGKESSLQFLIGQGMKKSKGSLNPQKFQETLKEKIKI